MTEYVTQELLLSAKNGDKDACTQLIESNNGLIWSIARRFFGRGVDPDDLYQLGCMGFLKAVYGFDPEFGTQFSTYAVPKITGEIRRFLRDDGSIKVSRTLKERSYAIKNARSALEQRLGREPTLSELSEETGFTAEDIATAETASAAPESLQKETGEDGFTLEHVLSDSMLEDKLVEYVSLREAINSLPEKERSVIILRFYRGLTQDKSAKILGISQVQVSRLERRALTSLRALLE
ncbi:MAG: sigma-70 family RNA polymerase sigma factor [Oscillospiraceae bacterium]|nr:sigma-70 family RNA polymerase sigma factor [Oscillospiraceae bacterium]